MDVLSVEFHRELINKLKLCHTSLDYAAGLISRRLLRFL